MTRFPLLLRVTHWVTLVSFVSLVVSGVGIRERQAFLVGQN